MYLRTCIVRASASKPDRVGRVTFIHPQSSPNGVRGERFEELIFMDGISMESLPARLRDYLNYAIRPSVFDPRTGKLVRQGTLVRSVR